MEGDNVHRITSEVVREVGFKPFSFNIMVV